MASCRFNRSGASVSQSRRIFSSIRRPRNSQPRFVCPARENGAGAGVISWPSLSLVN